MRLPWWLPVGKAPEIKPEELKRWLDEGRGLQFADARTAAEFHSGTLPGARHAPLAGMPDSLANIPLDRGRPVVMLCLSGHRSLPGTRWLRGRGYEAYSLKGGLMAWKRLGYELERTDQRL